MFQNKENKLFLGDCLEKMRLLEKNSIDLIYLDPPFFSKKTHKLTNKERIKEFSFDDIWKNNAEYTSFLEERIFLMRDLLKETGSIFVHCDKNGEHIIRAILDKVFGSSNFQSEIIWFYKRWSNSKKGLLPSHQNIYFYSKSNQFKFNTIYVPYSETTNIDQILQRRTRDKNNKSVYDLDKRGNVKLADAKRGVPLSDVWEIPYLNPKARERVGYPTQKPLLLLERIVELTTQKGDLILDPFCGSGTTCVAATLSERKFIGIDISEEAINLAKIRIEHPIKTESNLLKKGRASYLNSDEEALKLLNGIPYNPVQRNKGIDAILVELYEGSPILVKIQKAHETLTEAAELLKKSMNSKQSIKSILIQTTNNSLIPEIITFQGIEVIQTPAISINDVIKKTLSPPNISLKTG